MTLSRMAPASACRRSLARVALREPGLTTHGADGQFGEALVTDDCGDEGLIADAIPRLPAGAAANPLSRATNN